MGLKERYDKVKAVSDTWVKKLEILKANANTEQNLLPQGDKVPADAQAFKDELKRIIKYVEELQANTKIECDKYSNDVKYWAEYRTGIKEFSPWLASAEKAATEGLSKPSDLDEVKALNDKVNSFDKTWVNKCEVLVKEWVLLDNTVTELNSWVAKDKSAEGENQFSLEKMESTLGELKNIFKQKEKLV